MLRYQVPELNHTNQEIDSIFYKDPALAEMIISKRESETELRKAAEQKRQEAEIVVKEAEELQQREKSAF